MKKIVNNSLFIMVLLLTANAVSAFCVWNKTTGKDTTGHAIFTHKHPTAIVMTNKYVLQGDYGCDTNGPRGENDTTTFNVEWMTDYYRGFHVAGWDTKPICKVTVFNKGGYVVVTGSKGNFFCQVYRD